MIYDFDGFQRAVLQAYHAKRENNELPAALERPTPARLRDSSLRAWTARPLAKDREVVAAFFDAPATDEGIESGIRRFDTEKFKPLINYLKGDTTKTHEKNIKFLAWLLDFEPRPYRAWQQQAGLPRADDDAIASTPVIISEREQIESTDHPAVAMRRSGSRRFTLQRAAWLAGIFAVAWGVLFFVLGQGTKQCMYWNEDRYVATRCADDGGTGSLRIALDRQQLRDFKKIMRPDTLARAHVGKVWYSKIDNTVEFFTGPGFHPVHRDRSLRAATAHIIDTYAAASETD